MHKLIVRSVFIFLFIGCFSAQGCYLFCFLRPENRIEEILERFVEEEIEILSETSSELNKATSENKAN
ncbi:MAG: hypothetical protein Q8L68_01495 [Methylococcales bacterium]|nr:hypothetical protein [Methylococcales bacterium]